jgi:hypothetical protein
MSNIIKKILPLQIETYLAVIKNSVGSKMFRNVYAKVNGKKNDITKDGDLSCAFFVSSILVLFKLIKEIHTTIDGTTKDLEDFGWIEIKKPKLGCILVWAEKDFGNNELHKHIGFYVGREKAISNSSNKKYPTEHNWDKYDGRKVKQILWHPKLEQK